MTLTDTGYCSTCHKETTLKRDPIDIPHERLIAGDRWETCLGCHDFHGNHLMKTKTRVEEVWPQAQLRAYFTVAAFLGVKSRCTWLVMSA